MITKVRNIHATDNRRVRLLPKNGAVGTPVLESESAVAIDANGTLAFCLTPAIMCSATTQLFQALASSGKTFAVGEGVALAAKMLVTPMGAGEAFSEHILHEYASNFFNPNDVVERVVPNVQFNIENRTPEFDGWHCVNGDLTEGIHVYFQNPSDAAGVVGSNLQYPITINGVLHDLRFTASLNSVHSYPTIEAFKTAIDNVYITLGNLLKGLGLGLDYELVGGGPFVNAVGLGSIRTSRLLVKWSSNDIVEGEWGSPLISANGGNYHKWWCSYVQSFGCKDGPADWKVIASDLGVNVTGHSASVPMEQKDGWVLEIGSHAHFGLDLPEGCVDYFTLCGLTDPVLLVSCTDDAPLSG